MTSQTQQNSTLLAPKFSFPLSFSPTSIAHSTEFSRHRWINYRLADDTETDTQKAKENLFFFFSLFQVQCSTPSQSTFGTPNSSLYPWLICEAVEGKRKIFPSWGRKIVLCIIWVEGWGWLIVRLFLGFSVENKTNLLRCESSKFRQLSGVSKFGMDFGVLAVTRWLLKLGNALLG